MKRIVSIMLIGFLLLMIFPVKNVKADMTVQAKSAILMDQDTGRILYEKDAYEPRSIASITKIMTAILAIESGKMNQKVTVSERAIRTEGSSLYLKQGDKWKLKDLVYGLMLRSGNDAANVIAESVGGSIEGFVFLMNQKAKEIGMKNTHFTNPSGLEDPNGEHYSTAYDMALLTRYAMQNKTYRKIAGTKFYKGWKNKNRLLTEKYKYCTGGKTGFTKKAHRTLVSTATKNGEHYIAVTLNDSDDWNDHIAMYQYGFKHYDTKIIVGKGAIQAITNKYLKNHVYVKHDITYPLAKNEVDSVNVDYQLVKPKKDWKDPKKIPQIVGKAVVYMDHKVIKTTPIYYQKKVMEHKESWKALFKEALLLDLGVKKDG
ncbi:D-alanyl-D-alanine carboxypeptidase family protein [Heyndrickxia ginsengihumi]|uniref:serine-type D-Ala-D-Ala carboxypeptidase n=1 Tax=Heyndrickxia ginsengihumi TaxID=363870 RepID=A0A0A6VC67_9BACI|nr:D-alanyl-D-alanine carboxypeptidase family protein [Heyndrickxia ginsengihumi]KHD85810.1 D-alanyl-D-alanine carboxypeptidase [Heyndrickxia ginsengihumi]MBE6184613.1 D-alanyl-D-alanine carboxypeptidase [Bacillus sp. (in: firmicutes)]MCM3022880.1 D-alanyl-D-alanine carboxypeptidase [Heyndrickxia ginsengihumi]NEY20692.1 D-alanyl-D-alanine carboxypeptidase [Heyndrickxia ginsengihumi]